MVAVSYSYRVGPRGEEHEREGLERSEGSNGLRWRTKGKGKDRFRLGQKVEEE